MFEKGNEKDVLLGYFLILSPEPLLFNLYINDLPFAFENTLSDPFVLPNGAKLNSLLYADDLIILSRSKTGLQNCLDKLSSFCTSWMMKINPKKTKIMVFQKRARKNADFHFLIDSQIIDVVQEYTYLGTRMSSSGNFSVSREHLKEKALHALFSLSRHTSLSKLKAALACKIFDTMISPILTYNSEIWGVYAKPDFKTWDGSQIEKAHLQFCKRYLEVNNKASNIACRAELGRFPLNITINQKILKYILYIQSKDEESLVKQAFLMSFDLHCNGKNSFHSHLMNMSEYFKLPDFNPDLLDIAMVKSYVSSMKQEYISYWQNTPQHSQKLEFCRSFKTDHTSSS